jgi:hypothetical protein
MAITQTPPLRLTRDQLALFLQDQQQIKAFENLFAIVESIAPDLVQQALLAAGSAQAAATDAQGQVQSAEQALGTMLAACEAKATLALQQVLALKHIADFVETAPPPREFKRSRYGQFYDTTTQNITTILTATPVTFDTTDISNGVRLKSPSTSEIEVDTEGLYNIQVSMQFDTTSGGAHLMWGWLRKNGVDIDNSAFRFLISGNNGELLQSFNYFVDLKAMDYIELMWAANDLNGQLVAFGPGTFRPGIPSVLLTVSNNIEGVES